MPEARTRPGRAGDVRNSERFSMTGIWYMARIDERGREAVTLEPTYNPHGLAEGPVVGFPYRGVFVKILIHD